MVVLAKDLRFGPFLPDLPDYNSPGSDTITNVLPVTNGYAPMKALSALSGALDDTPKGHFSVVDTSGNVTTFAGDDTKLYKQDAADLTWDDVSKVGGYNLTATDYWDFTQFGNFVIAVNLQDPPQVWELGVSTVFADLGGSPPQAKYVATVKDFLFLAYLDESGTIDPYGVRWSAAGDHTLWPTIGSDTAIANQSDRQTLEAQFGEITGLVVGLQGGDAAIFQERGIQRTLFTGSPFFFSFDQIEGSRGTVAPNGIVQIGGYVFYLSVDGYYAFDGVNSRPIGQQMVDRTFFEQIAAGGGDFLKVFGVADPARKLIYWFYPAEGAATDTANATLVYSWDIQEWSSGDGYEVLFASNALSNGFTLETLDNISTNLDLLPASLDSPIWQGGDLRIGAWNSDNKFATFDGANLQALLDTRETQISQQDRLVFVRELWPHFENSDDSSMAMALGCRYSTNDAISYSGFTAPNSMGFSPTRKTARFARVRARLTAGTTWDFVQSCDIIGDLKGRR